MNKRRKEKEEIIKEGMKERKILKCFDDKEEKKVSKERRE